MLDSFVLANAFGDPRLLWAPVVLLIIMGVGFSVAQVVLSALVGPSRTGSVKEMTYESGMAPAGTDKKRFNIRFYLVAIMFVAFDVEIVILYPWAVSFAETLARDSELGIRMFVSASVFMFLVLIGYLYDIGKGVLKWE
jgi:NADH-quinone oxidoreductase subunit A